MLFLEAVEEAGARCSFGIEKSLPSCPCTDLENATSFGLECVAEAYSMVSVPQSCLAVGIANGVRGGMIGAAFGGVFAAVNMNSAGLGLSGSKAAYVGQAAARNAGAFAAWTSLYGFSRCQLVKMRRRNDFMNAAMAGAFTGTVLSLATMPRMYWRFSSQQILHNAGGSALIAVVFDMANRL